MLLYVATSAVFSMPGPTTISIGDPARVGCVAFRRVHQRVLDLLAARGRVEHLLLALLLDALGVELLDLLLVRALGSHLSILFCVPLVVGVLATSSTGARVAVTGDGGTLSPR